MEVCSAWADCRIECPDAVPNAQPCSVPALWLIPSSMAPARAQPPIHVGWSFCTHHLIYTIPSPPQLCSLLLRALLSIWQHLQLLPPLLAGQLCHQMCHCPASLFLLTWCLQQARSLCCLCLAAARKVLLQNLPHAYGGEERMRRGEEVVEEGERGMGKEKNRVKNRKEGKRKKGERERQKEEGGTGKRGKEEKRKRGKGEKERFQPAGRGRRQHVQHQPLRCGTQRSKKCRCQRQR